MNKKLQLFACLFICVLTFSGCSHSPEGGAKEQASIATSPTSKRLYWGQVRRKLEVSQSECKFMKQQICSTGRDNGIATCEIWHKKRAARAGADTIVVISTASEDRYPFGLISLLFNSKSTSMTADYFSCAAKPIDTTATL